MKISGKASLLQAIRSGEFHSGSFEHLANILREDPLAESIRGLRPYPGARYGTAALSVASTMVGETVFEAAVAHLSPGVGEYAAPWVRHCTASGEIMNRLYQDERFISALEPDEIRMRILLSGYLGKSDAEYHFAKKYGLPHSEYWTEKLASYCAQARLADLVFRQNQDHSESFELYTEDAIKTAESDKERRHAHPSMYGRYAEVLRHMRPALGRSVLRIAKKSNSYDLFLAAADRLAEVPNPRLVDSLSECFEEVTTPSDAIGEAKWTVGVALAQINNSEALTALEELQQSDPESYRVASAVAYGLGNEVDLERDPLRHVFPRSGDGLWEAGKVREHMMVAWALGKRADGGESDALEKLQEVAESCSGLWSAISVAGLAKAGQLDSKDLRRYFDLAEDTRERVIIGCAGAWISESELLLDSLVEGPPLRMFPVPIRNEALDAIRSQDAEPFPTILKLILAP